MEDFPFQPTATQPVKNKFTEPHTEIQLYNEDVPPPPPPLYHAACLLFDVRRRGWSA